ncbi:NINE protein [uncultured Erythrobacter sp.]|uniref:TM2 domain-containing protein n=1 Tax=uncultured Erythrobacter sp. TaxID=263913 RepID=UPI00261A762A|nr:NINE protein [uncultured Erythrobacter sp.]
MDDNFRKQMVFESNRKSVGIAYLLWLLLGGFGVHRFYTGNTASGVAQLILLISFIGWLVLIPWLLIDLALIPGMVRDKNMEVINMLNHADPKGAPPEEPRPAEREPLPITNETDRRRQAMLDDLRQTGYRKERRDRFPLNR